MRRLILHDRMKGRPVEVTTEDIVGAFCDNDRGGAVESLEAKVESLIRLISILVDESPQALERLMAIQWRFEK